MSQLLFEESPLVVNVTLATKLGLNEAIVLQQIHYWLQINKKNCKSKDDDKHYKDGCFWTYNSIKKWSETFPFFSDSTLRRTFNQLEKLKILKVANYNELKMDRTKWYTIDYKILDEYIDNNDNPNKKMTNAFGQNEQMEESKLNECNCSNSANGIGQNEQSNTRDYPKTSSETYSKTSTSIIDVVDFFQNNFYLPKAFEAELMTDWAKRHPPDLVIEAMKVARMKDARNLKYIERVLENWEKEGICSVELLKAREDDRNVQTRRNGQDGSDSKATNESNQYSGLGLKL